MPSALPCRRQACGRAPVEEIELDRTSSESGRYIWRLRSMSSSLLEVSCCAPRARPVVEPTESAVWRTGAPLSRRPSLPPGASGPPAAGPQSRPARNWDGNGSRRRRCPAAGAGLAATAKMSARDIRKPDPGDESSKWRMGGGRGREPRAAVSSAGGGGGAAADGAGLESGASGAGGAGGLRGGDGFGGIVE